MTMRIAGPGGKNPVFGCARPELTVLLLALFLLLLPVAAYAARPAAPLDAHNPAPARAELPASLRANPHAITETVTSQGTGIPLCFWSDGGPACVTRIGLATAGVADPTATLQALLSGPTPDEQARGLTSAIPPGTALADFRMASDGTTVVSLDIPPEGLRAMSPEAIEAAYWQIAQTLEFLDWRDLRVNVRDPATGQFVPLASFLPDLPAPRKETVTDEGDGRIAPIYIGQPSAPGHGQPQGALKGKTVYISAGHGWLWTGYNWKTQRAPYPASPYEGPIIEDHNNAEAVNQYLLGYLWNAGARVIPVRERDMNAAAVVVDNDNPAPGTYAENGLWSTSSLTGYRGTTYRYAATVTGTATATATWVVPVPADGRYAVYVWYRQGANRAPDARYTVHHAGGQTGVTVDQRAHGNTWHYLGTYGFRGGTVATITLSNLSAYPNLAVIADAVRLGGGVFSSLTEVYTTTAAYPPDKPWWEVGAFYQVQRMGLNPSGWPSYGYFNDVVARPMYARWEHAGTGEDAVYISWHSNGYNGYQTTARGTETYAHNGEGAPRTEGSLELRHAVHTEIIRVLRAAWDPAWPDRGEKLANFGELRELWDDDPTVRMPGALVEVAFHDNPTDADALKEPTFARLVARAMYQGIVKYFETRDGMDLPVLPEPPTHLAVRNLGGGEVQVSWRPPSTDPAGLFGDPPTGYRVYTSTDGIGWSDGVPVTGTTVYTLTGLSPGQLLFVRVTATNAGGESFPTGTLAVRVGGGAPVLVVNGFDRLNRTMRVPDYDPVMGANLRMFLNRMNSYDYVVQHAAVITYPLDSASNEAVRDGDISLNGYRIVDWILGEESAPDETLDAAERALLQGFLENGGALFISGTEIGWHLDHLETDPAFYRDYLRAAYVADDAGTYVVTPAANSIFAGLPPFRFDTPGMYDPDYPDVIAPVGGAQAALTYVGGVGGTAAVQYADGCRRVVHFAFPFETISADMRSAVMARVMDFLDECVIRAVDIVITSPTYAGIYSAAPPFAGVATAQGGEIARVEVQIEQDGRYWSGSDWVSETVWLTATGTTSWSYDLAPALETDGEYSLAARAWLGAYRGASTVSALSGEGGPIIQASDGDMSGTAEVQFIYDATPPEAATLITPTGGVVIPALPAAVLRWQPPPPDGGTPYQFALDVDGQRITVTEPVYTCTFPSEGEHTWGVQVVDLAGNASPWVMTTFVVRREKVFLPVVMRGFTAGPPPPPPGLLNGGFETDEGWTLNRLAAYTTTLARSGVRSVRLGIPPGEPGQYVYSSVSQTFVVPAEATTLTLWVYMESEGDPDDLFYVSLRVADGQLHFLGTWRPGDGAEGQWVRRQYDLRPYAGQQVTLYIGVKNDGDDLTAAMYVDDVSLIASE